MNVASYYSDTYNDKNYMIRLQVIMEENERNAKMLYDRRR